MADVYSAIIETRDPDVYWNGTTSWGGETSEANRDTKYSTRRYTSVAAWEVDRDGNASSGDNEYGIISGAWAAAETGLLYIKGWTSGVTKIYLQCPILTTDGETNPARHAASIRPQLPHPLTRGDLLHRTSFGRRIM